MFYHNPPTELLELNDEMINGKRFYHTPKGKYPSITSVLGSFPKPEIVEWRNSVGEQEANRISKMATSRGTSFHSLCENYLNNKIVSNKGIMPDALQSFYSIKPFLKNVNNIHHLESPLYSDELKVAGRTDAIAEYKGILSIIDFKTSKKEKNESNIHDYFLQSTFYSCAYWELTQIKVKQIVILISVDDGFSQEFVKPINPYLNPLIKKINYFYEYLFV